MRVFRASLAAWFVALGLHGWVGAAGVAEPPGADRAELLRLSEERAVIAQQFTAESAQCERRFFVNACLDEAKSKRSAALRPLELREAALDAQERRARAAAQRERVSQREREFAEAEGRERTAQLLAAPAPAAPVAAKAGPDPAATPAVPSQQPSPQQSQKLKADKAQDEAKRREAQKADYQREQALRQKEAERRQAVNDAKQKGKQPPAGLPIPSAAEIEAAGSAAPPVKR